MTEEQAVADLEAWRGKDTINRLSDRLRDREKRVLVRQEKRKSLSVPQHHQRDHQITGYPNISRT